jgi:hypothetical protein
VDDFVREMDEEVARNDVLSGPHAGRRERGEPAWN